MKPRSNQSGIKALAASDDALDTAPIHVRQSVFSEVEMMACPAEDSPSDVSHISQSLRYEFATQYRMGPNS